MAESALHASVKKKQLVVAHFFTSDERLHSGHAFSTSRENTIYLGCLVLLVELIITLTLSGTRGALHGYQPKNISRSALVGLDFYHALAVHQRLGA